jgi:hypothetical protein
MSDFQQYLERLSVDHQEAEARFNEEVQKKYDEEREGDEKKEMEQMASLPFEEELIKHGGAGILKGGLKKLGLNTTKDFEKDVLKNPVQALLKEAQKQAKIKAKDRLARRAKRLQRSGRAEPNSLEQEDKLKAPSLTQADKELADKDFDKFFKKVRKEAKKRKLKVRPEVDSGEDGSGSAGKTQLTKLTAEEPTELSAFDDPKVKVSPRLKNLDAVLKSRDEGLTRADAGRLTRLARGKFSQQAKVGRFQQNVRAKLLNPESEDTPTGLQQPRALFQEEAQKPVKLTVDGADSDMAQQALKKALKTGGDGTGDDALQAGRQLLKGAGLLDDSGNLIGGIESGFEASALAEGGLNPIADVLALGAGLAGLFGSIFGGKSKNPAQTVHEQLTNPSIGFGIQEGN